MNRSETPKGLVRLTQLFYLLGTARNGKIRLLDWRFDTVRNTSHVGDEDLKSVECGTVACAVGFACLHPQFNKEGLTWDHVNDVPKYVNPESQSVIYSGS